MTYIQTVLGRVEPEDIGFTLPHEHVICDSTLCRSHRESVKRPPWGTYMWLDDVDVMSDELCKFRKDGGHAIIDVTCHGWGRDPRALKYLSERSGVHLIACTGFYVEDCMPYWVEISTVEQLANWIVREIEVGCNARISSEVTPIKAGIIKTSASGPVFNHNELKGLKAVAEAHLRTGMPITSHNSGSIRYELDGGNIGMEMLGLLEEEGIDPEAVIVGHTDENVDIRNLVILAKRGAWIQFDTIGKEHYILDETRSDLIVALKERGFLDHLLLSQDRNRKPMLRKYGGPGYSDIINRFIPLLLEKGLTQKDVFQVTVRNPSKALRKRDM
jgi:predicted metal-dependent phosphotriesterase family hydrolase